MPLKVLNWNVAGAKFLEEPVEKNKREFRKKLNADLRVLIKRHKPHVIALQEIVAYSKPGEARRNIIQPPPGYIYHPCILINTVCHPHVSKWRKVQEKGKWPDGTYFGQGNAMLWQRDLPHFPVWELPRIHAKPDGGRHVEEVILMSGLYFGDRNTEPRAAIVSHFVINRPLNKKMRLEKALDVFVVNLHLTTLMGERQGIPQIDEQASRIRLGQLDIILNGIISRYNDWRWAGYPFRSEHREPRPHEDFERHSPVWVLCGDFNFTPGSVEYATMQRNNFVDMNPRKGTGTKGSGFGSEATITCDYIFGGPKYIALEPLIVEQSIRRNPMPDYSVDVSDHFPIFARIPLSTLG